MFGDFLNDIKNAIGGVVSGVQHALGIGPPPPQAPSPLQRPVAPPPPPAPTMPFNGLATAMQQAQQAQQLQQQQDQQKKQQAQQLGNQFLNGPQGLQQLHFPVAKPANPIIGTAEAIGQKVGQGLQAAQHVIDPMSNPAARRNLPPMVISSLGKDPVTGEQNAAEVGQAIGADVPAARAPKAIEEAPAAIENMKNAAQELAQHYASGIKPQKDINDLMGQVNGATQLGQHLAKNFANAIRKVLPSSQDRQQVFHALDGAVDPATLNPAQQAVHAAVQGLNEQGLNIRQAIDPNVRQVENYATRLVKGVKGGGAFGSRPQSLVQGLRDLFDTKSGFSTSRVVGKFLGPDGKPVFGTPQNLGLTQQADGTYTNAKNEIYNPVRTTVQEIEQNNAANYEKDISKVVNAYHSDTSKIKARSDAVQELTQNPDQYGVHQDTDGFTPAGYREITGVPELHGWSASPKVAKAIENNFKPETSPNVIARTWQGLNNAATQLIVMNPTVHGINLLVQAGIQSGNMPLFKGAKMGAGPIGTLRFGAHWMAAVANPKYRERIMQQYFRDGGHVATYGRNSRSVVSNVLDKMNLPHVNKANSAAMNAIEGVIRASLHDANRAAGMKPKQSVRQIDTFLGKKENLGPIAKNAGMFYHWLKTQTTAIGQQARHPIQNIGANTNTLALAAVGWGITKAWQDATGNQNAHLSPRGEFSIMNKVDQLAHGQFRQVASGLTNPGINTAVDQITGTNVFGQKLTTPQQRLSDAARTLVSPIDQAVSSTRSVGEKLLNLEGAYIPHAAGAPGAPKIPVLNVAGAKAATGSDQTGYSQEQQHFKVQAQVMGSLGTNDQGVVQKYFNKDTDQNGNTLLRGPKREQSDASDLFANDNARKGVAQIEKANASHDPQWDLPDAQLKTFMRYQSMAPGSGDAEALKQANPWINNLESARSAYFSSNKFTSNAQADPNDPQVKYPLSAQQGALMGQAGKITDPAQKTQFYKDHPELAQIDYQYGQYINQKRVALGYQPIPLLAPPDANLQAQLNEYAKVPKGGGSKGGNKYEALFLDSHPDVANYFGQTALSSLLRQASIQEAGGTAKTSQMMKDIKTLGYDIVKNTDGTYSFNPTAAAAASKSSSSGSSTMSPSFRVPELRPMRFGQGSRPRPARLKFKVPRSRPVHPYRQQSAGPAKGSRNMGVKSTNDTIRST